MDYNRKEHNLPLATEEWGWKYHHMGVPVKDPIPGERYIPHLKFYVKGFDTSPFGIELMRFENDCPLDEIIKTMPHIAFEVPDLEKAIKGFELIGEPNSPMEGIKVAMIKHNGVPIELMKIKK
ncbi:MAG: hypothetical protein PF485_14535 [Bacteroidales bacterium]|jgi:hypothetical protein|nr:hypothetical protein [Bacteroidales bacterium]